MPYWFEPTSVSVDIGGRTMTLETGKVAKQAAGAVTVTFGDTVVLVTAVHSSPRPGIDFFPLTVDFVEKFAAAGKIPGGFFKREGRPTTKEILTMRVIDRAIRPLFPKGLKAEVQVMSRVFGYDGSTSSDILAMIASFAALHISNIPFERALGAVRIGHLDGSLSGMPTDQERREPSRLDLVVAGHSDAIVMVEASAKQLPEDEMIDALEMAHNEIQKIVALIDELREKVGKPKMEFTPPEVNEELQSAVEGYRDRLKQALRTEGKHTRDEAVSAVKKDGIEALTRGIEDERELYKRTKEVKNLFYKLTGSLERELILEGTRVDGRRHDEIRQITIEPGFIKMHHGSALFTRGETQAIVSTTLGTPDDEAIIDGIEDEYRKRFYLHYSFPPFSVGETRRIMGPGRREIGHGMLAERALSAVLPDHDRFPYTVRIVSEILESNGSSSMATVCGGCPR